MAQIFARDQFDLLAFVPIDRRFPGFYIARGARLYLYKAKNIVFPSNQVDLSTAPRRAEVTGDHGVTELSEMEIGSFLTAAANEAMGSDFFRRQGVRRQPIEKFKQRVRGPPRE